MDVLHEGLLQKWVLGSAGIEFSRVSWLKIYQQGFKLPGTNWKTQITFWNKSEQVPSSILKVINIIFKINHKLHPRDIWSLVFQFVSGLPAEFWIYCRWAISLKLILKCDELQSSHQVDIKTRSLQDQLDEESLLFSILFFSFVIFYNLSS